MRTDNAAEITEGIKTFLAWAELTALAYTPF